MKNLFNSYKNFDRSWSDRMISLGVEGPSGDNESANEGPQEGEELVDLSQFEGLPGFDEARADQAAAFKEEFNVAANLTLSSIQKPERPMPKGKPVSKTTRPMPKAIRQGRRMPWKYEK